MGLKQQFEQITDYHNATRRIALDDVSGLQTSIVERLTTASVSAKGEQLSQFVKIANTIKPQVIVAKAIYEPAEQRTAFGEFLDVLDKQTGGK